MKQVLICLSAVLCSLSVQAKVITCQNSQAIGIPVVQIKIENNEVLEARELLQSNLTGIISGGARLKQIPSNSKNDIAFDLGSNGTTDYKLVVALGQDTIGVRVESIDRDDWTGTTTVLVNCR